MRSSHSLIVSALSLSLPIMCGYIVVPREAGVFWITSPLTAQSKRRFRTFRGDASLEGPVITDLQQADSNTALDAQICVVGGGAVGLVLATTLAERGADVLVLEGGGIGLENRSQALQAGESIGHPFGAIGEGRYRVLGGTTIYWGGQVLPFDEFVTGERPWLGYSAWPIEPAVLQFYFLEAYRRLGLGQVELDDARVWTALGAGTPDMGPGLEVVMTRWLKTKNFARLFCRQLRSNHGPRVMVHANVVSMELSPDGDAVSAIRARSLDGKEVTVRARQFVLANGSLEIVRLLKHPLADGSQAPWVRAKWLGTPLTDTLDCTAGEVQVLDHEQFHRLFDNIYLGGHKYYPKVRLAPDLQRSEGLVDIAAQFRYRTQNTEHIQYLKAFVRSIRQGGVKVSSRKLPEHVASVLSTSLPMARRYIRDRRSFHPMGAEVSLVFNCEQLPFARSRIELGDEVDALGMRCLRVDWQLDGRELKTMKFFGRLLKQELESRGLACVTLDRRLDDEDPAFRAAIHDGIHQMGVARIGRTSDEGFVDPNLKVFGMHNLNLAGAAVFPSTGFANPTFTAIALALRLCDRLVI
jgi:glycine/D-amino acid oxidase-like deaminating enzyme